MRILEFKTEYRVGKDPQDWVLIAGEGEAFETLRTWHRVKDMMPKTKDGDDMQPGSAAQVAVERWEVIDEAYQAWKKGEELPTTGTPLAAWSGLNADQAAVVRKFGILTVEQFSEATDGQIQKFPFPNSRELRGMAKSFLESRDATAKDAEIADMKAQIEALKKEFASGVADVEDADEDENKPKRGRPRKEAA